MCRSIKRLNLKGIKATDEEIYSASLQFVRKISGFRKPSKVNEKVYTKAVKQIAKATNDLLGSLETKVKIKSRGDYLPSSAA